MMFFHVIVNPNTFMDSTMPDKVGYWLYRGVPLGVPIIISLFLLKFINIQGTNKKLKRDMITRHFIYITLYEIYFYCIIHDFKIHSFAIITKFKVIWAMISFLMTLNRIVFEPAIKTVLKVEVKRLLLIM